MKFIKSLDNFGYTPQFLISGEGEYKSVPGGIIFVCFAIFACWYLISQSIGFISRLHDVQTSRTIITQSEIYNITTKDLYFGIGLVDYSNNEYNMSQNFSYLNFTMSVIKIDQSGNTRRIDIQLAECQIEYFISDLDLLKMDKTDAAEIKNRLPFYLCPPLDFNFLLNSPNFGEGEEFIQLQIDIVDSSVLSYAKENLFDVRPRLNFIYRNLIVESESFDSPFSSYITSFYNEIDYEFAKKTEVFMNPFEMLDDTNYFTGVKYEADVSSFSSQPNNTVFQITRNTDRFSYVSDRTKYSYNQYNIYKLKIYLNPKKNKLLRSYQKFTAFLAGVTAILSNVLLIFALVMIQYNSIQGTNNMIKSMFTFESIKNMKYFNIDLKEVLKKQNSSLNVNLILN